MSSLRYVVRLDAPARHTVEVTLTFVPAAASTDVTMPAWCPGSYLIRDYARFARDLDALGDDGRPRTVSKVDKQTWRIDTAGAREVTVRYTMYGHDLTVRTNHIDATHAFLHGPATFLFPTTHRTAPIELELHGPADWPLVTALDWHATTLPATVRAATIDELYDHPIHIGATRMFAVPARVPVRLAIWGDRSPGGTFTETRLAEDLAAIVDDHVARVGEAPFPNYTFVLMLSHDAYGGLEHRASSINLYHPHFASSRKAYDGLLELLSHELFHAWNGKRIAPRPLLELDYSREAYTPCLWVMEGLTSHYDRYALRTSQRITGKSFLEKVLDDWARLMATPGRAKQSLEAASFDAWIKLYKPDESNLNTTVSYYLKGGLSMFVLDLHIRRRTEGARSMDDVLRALWQRFGKPGVPHPDDLQGVFEEATGLSLDDVFAREIRGTGDPALAEELLHVGLELRTSSDPAQIADGASALWLGATVSGTKVTAVFDASPADASGLSPGDEIIALDGFRTTSEADLRSLAGARRAGDTVAVSVFRRHRLVELPVVLAPAPATRYEIAGVADPGPAANRFQAWLGEPHPGSAVLATVTTTARWV
jgi:predicted metalloprotease with PDZ domain